MNMEDMDCVSTSTSTYDADISFSEDELTDGTRQQALDRKFFQSPDPEGRKKARRRSRLETMPAKMARSVTLEELTDRNDTVMRDTLKRKHSNSKTQFTAGSDSESSPNKMFVSPLAISTPAKRIRTKVVFEDISPIYVRLTVGKDKPSDSNQSPNGSLVSNGMMSDCTALNDAFVRQWLNDSASGNETQPSGLNFSEFVEAYGRKRGNNITTAMQGQETDSTELTAPASSPVGLWSSSNDPLMSQSFRSRLSLNFEDGAATRTVKTMLRVSDSEYSKIAEPNSSQDEDLEETATADFNRHYSAPTPGFSRSNLKSPDRVSDLHMGHRLLSPTCQDILEGSYLRRQKRIDSCRASLENLRMTEM